MKLLRGGRHGQRGQTLAEFAMIAPLLVLLIFGFIDMARIYNAWVTIEGAAREAARYGVTGRDDCATATDDRTACIIYAATVRASSLTNSQSDLSVSVRSWNFPAYANPATEDNPGDQCDALEVQVDYDFTAATPLIGSIIGAVELTGRERLVNEPFGVCE